MRRLWQLANLFGDRPRGLSQELMRFRGIGIRSELELTLVRRNGLVVPLGVVGRRVVTNAGVAYLAAAFTGTGAASNVNYHDAGTGANAENVTDVALQTPWGGARVAGAQSTPGATNIYRSVATIPFTGGFAITEWGLFTAAAGVTLFDRFKFAAINVVNGDSIQGTFNLTLPAGG